MIAEIKELLSFARKIQRQKESETEAEKTPVIKIFDNIDNAHYVSTKNIELN